MTMIDTYLCKNLEEAKDWLENLGQASPPITRMQFLPPDWDFRPQFASRRQRVDWGCLGYRMTAEELRFLVEEAAANSLHEVMQKHLAELNDVVNSLEDGDYFVARVEIA